MAQSTVIAKVSSVSGEAYARDSAGNSRRLKAGDVIREGETVVTANGGEVVLALADGRSMVVVERQSVTLDAEVAAQDKPDAADGGVASSEVGFEQLAGLIAEGGDLDALVEAEATAAGEGASGNEGHSFVEFLRVVETVSGQQYGFSTERSAPEDTLQGDRGVELSREIAVSNLVVAEGDWAIFAIALSNPGSITQRVSFDLVGIDAVLGDDFSAEIRLSFDGGITWLVPDENGFFQIPAGVTAFHLGVPTLADEPNRVFEGPETFLVEAVLAENGVAGKGEAVIVDDGSPSDPVDVIKPDGNGFVPVDDRPVVSVSSLTVAEGFSAVFTVSLSNATKADVPMSLSLQDGSAEQFSDYLNRMQVSFDGGNWVSLTDGLLVLPAGVTTYFVAVPTIADEPNPVYEGPEDFQLTASIVGSELSTQTAAGNASILDDGSSGDPLPPGITVPPPVPTGIPLPPDVPFDDRPVVSVSNVTVAEGFQAVFTVNLSTPSKGEQSMSLVLANGSAVLGEDYLNAMQVSFDGLSWSTPNGGLLTLPPGVTSYFVSVPTVADEPNQIYEGAETFSLSASIIGSALASQSAAGTATILDDGSSGDPLPPGVPVPPPVPPGGDSPPDAPVDDRPKVSISVSPAAVQEDGDAVLVYTVSLSNPSNFQTTVTYTLSGTAEVGVDYLASVARSVTIPAGQLTATFIVDPVADTIVEDDETVVATLTDAVSNGTSLSIVTPSATGVILNDDVLVIPPIAVSDVSAGNPTNAPVTIDVLGNDSDPDGNLDVTTVQIVGTSAPGDSLTIPGQGVWSVNTGTGAITFTPEAGFTANPSPIQYSVADNDGNVSNPAAVTVNYLSTVTRVGDDAVVEGNTLVYTVTLSEATTQPSTYDYAIGGTATDGDDFTAPSFSDGVTYDAVAGTITVPAGVTSFTVSYPTVDDTVVESTETLTVTIDGVTGTGQILDNDKPTIITVEPGVPGVGDDAVVEGNTLVYTVTLSEATTQPSTYDYAIGGTATDGDDFTAPSFSDGVTYDAVAGTITVPAGVTSFTVSYPTVDDTVVESTETLTVTIDGVTGTGQILDNDKPTIITVEPGVPGVGDDAVVEGNTLVYTVTLSEATTQPSTYDYAIGGTATDGDDFTAPSFSDGVTYDAVAGTITVPAGVTSFTVSYPTVDDTVVESTETLTVTIDGVTGTGQILDNDKPTIITVEPGVPGVGDDAVVEGNTLVYTVTLSEATTQPSTYDYAIGGTATDGDDFTAPSFSDGVTYDAVAGTITVPAGVSSFTVSYPTVDDTVVESTETLTVTIDGVTGTGQILDNDKPTIITVEPGVPGVGDDAVVEGNTLVYTVTLSEATTQPSTYDYAIGGTATDGDDFTAPSFSDGVTYDAVAGTITVPAGVSSFTVSYPTVDDTVVESTETLTVTIDGVTGTGQILDNDKPTIITVEPGVPGVGDDAVVEGNTLVYTVTLSEATTQPSTYDYAIGGTATDGDDFTAPSFSDGVTYDAVAGTITVPAGVTSFTVSYPTVDDTVVESTETLTVTIDGVTGTGQILDNDKPTIITVEPGVPGVGDDAVVEGNTLVYTVTLSEATTQPSTYDYAIGGTATDGDDFTAPSFSDGVTYDAVAGTITVPAGVTSFTVSYPTVDDTVVESTETLTVTIDGVTGTGQILDNDKPTIITVEPGVPGVGDDAVVEGNTLVYTVTLSEATTQPSTYDYAIGGTATDGDDFTAPSFSDGVTYDAVAGTITVPAGVTSFTVSYPTVDDTVVESTETLTVTIDGVTGTGQILDNDKPTIITVEPGVPGVGDDAVVEGNTLVYTVTLSEATTQPSTYDYAIGGTATDGDDFTAPSFSDGVTYDAVAGTITVPAGVSSFTVSYPTVDDTVVESTETLTVTIDGVTGTGQILDNDKPTIITVEPGVPGVGDDAVVEGNTLVYTVTLSEATTQPSTYDYAIGGTATDGDDFTAPSFSDGVTYDAVAGTITVPAGVTSFTVSYPTVDDTVVESTETLTVTIDGVTGTGQILDNDKPTIITVEPGVPGVGDDAVVEGNTLVYTVTLSEATTQPSTYDYAIGGTATDGDDFTAPSFSDGVTYDAVAGTITVPAGVTSFTVSYPTVDDTVVESTETLTVTIDGVTGTGQILDNDKPTIITVEPGVPGVGDDAVVEGNTLVYTVTLSEATTQPSTYDYAIGGTATDGDDFTAPSFSDGVTYDAVAGTITVPAGVTSFTVSYPTVDDTVVESTETLTVTIDGVTGTGQILDNDKPTIITVEPGVPGVGDDAVVEGNTLVYTVTLSEATTQPSTYDYAIGGTATDGDDFTAPSFSDGVTYDAVAGTITVPAGVSSFTVSYPTVDDTVVESTETLTVTIDGVTGTGQILDNDKPTIITVEPGVPGVGDDAVVEGNTLVYTVTLSEATTQPSTYDYAIGGTATDGDDFTAPSFSDGVTYDAVAGTITVPAGVSSFTVSYPTVDDTVVESTETLTVTIDGVTGTGQILDNDKPTIITVEPGVPGVGDDAVVEGNTLVYTVTLSEATTQPSTYDYAIGGTATDGDDFTAPSFSDGVTYDAVAGTITVPAGVTSFTVSYPTVDDTVVESTETLTVTIDGVTGTGQILDNDKPTIITVEPGVPGVGDDAVVEGNTLVYTVTLSEATTQPSTYDYAIGGTATDGDDFTAPSFSDGVTYDAVAGTITVPAGVTSFTVSYPTVDDTVVESTETLTVTIDGVTGTGQILDNDKPTIITVEPGVPGVGDDAVVEGNTLVYTVTLSEATTQPSTYDYAIGGTATDGDDFTAPSFSDGVTYDAVAGTITVPAGVSSFTVSYPTVDDTVVESTETLTVTIDGVTGTGQILDNDKPTIITVEPGVPGVGDDAVVEGNTLVYTVTLSEATTQPSTYDYAIGGTATDGDDFTAPSFSDGVTYDAVAGTITVPAGVSSFTVSYPTVDDTVVESTETLTVTIDGVTGTGQILDNDIVDDVEVVSTPEDQLITGSVLTNAETGPVTTAVVTSFVVDGDAQVHPADNSPVVVVQNGQNIGTLRIDSNGDYSFEPFKDYSGPVPTVTYTVSNGLGTDTSTLDISVTPVADVPNVTIQIGNPVTNNVTINNTNASVSGQGYTVTAFNLDGSQGAVSVVNAAAGGNVSGFGVTQASSGSDTEIGHLNGNSEKIVVTFDDPVTSATIQFAWLHPGERATYTLFDDQGNQVGQGTVAGVTDVVDSPFTVISDNGADIARVEFTAPRAGDDYLIHSLTFAQTKTHPLTITATPTDIDYSEEIATITVTVPAGVTLSHGTQNPDGTWTLPLTSDGPYVVTVDPVTKAVTITGLTMTTPVDMTGSMNITVTATARDGADLASASASIATLGILSSIAVVSEEGLANGNPDSAGSPDTTNAVVFSGSMSIAGEGSLGVSFDPPTSITSGGQTLSWTTSVLGSGDTVLSGSANGQEILTVTMQNNGNYTVELKGPVDHPVTNLEDLLRLDIGVTVSNGTNSQSSVLTVLVEDDSPNVGDVEKFITFSPVTTNLVIILDVSGSMGSTAAGTTQTRLALAKAAIADLVNAYDGLGQVNVKVISFNDDATERLVSGQEWLSASASIQVVNALNSGGGTDYDDPLRALINGYSAPSADQSFVYFLSDGEPNTSTYRNEITNYSPTWKQFADANFDTVYAVGMGSNVPETYLDLVSLDDNTLLVTSESQLSNQLLATLNLGNEGVIFDGSATTGVLYGADGGSGIDYIEVQTTAGSDAYTRFTLSNADATGAFSVTTKYGATFNVNFVTGDYEYSVNPLDNGGVNYAEVIRAATSDRDGDQNVGSLTINVDFDGPRIVDGTPGNDSLIGLAGSDVFRWDFGDEGTAGSPAEDTVTDFGMARLSEGGDALDLRDLLVGENSGNLENYLDFDTTSSAGDTIIRISSDGSFSGGNYAAGVEDQRIVLEGVNIRADLGLDSNASDNQIINALLSSGKLITD
jgi:T1SS-143 domain-containing protein